MVVMNMVAFAFTGHKRTKENTSTWRIGSADMREVTFPSNERISELWGETVKDGGDLQVIESDGSNYRGAEIPRGIKPAQRVSFLEALAHEVMSTEA
jgi:hypothetical protein